MIPSPLAALAEELIPQDLWQLVRPCCHSDPQAPGTGARAVSSQHKRDKQLDYQESKHHEPQQPKHRLMQVCGSHRRP